MINKEFFKILSAWLFHISHYHFSEYCLRNSYLDQLGPYDWRSEEARDTLQRYGHTFYVTAPFYPPDPLPDWIIAAILAEPRGWFLRISFGHEAFNYVRCNSDPNYLDLRPRAYYTFSCSSRERQEEIGRLANQLRWF